MFTHQPALLKTPVLWLQPLKERIDSLLLSHVPNRKQKHRSCVWLYAWGCVYMCTLTGICGVDSAGCYVTEGELLRILPSARHLFAPSWWGSQINTRLTSNLHFAGRKVHIDTAGHAYSRTHAHSLSKSSLTLPMVLHDRLQAALMNTHTKPNQTHFHGHTQDGAYLPGPVGVLHFPKELPLEAHRRKAEPIILDISGAEQLSYNNSYYLLSLLNRSGQMFSRALLDRLSEINTAFNSLC